MAKKKAQAASERKPMIAQLRGSDEYKVWIEQGAKFDNRSVAGLIERAVAVYLREIGFLKEAPER